MIVKSPGHAKIADFDSFVAGHQAVSAGNVPMDEADFVEILEATRHVETHLRQSRRIHFLGTSAPAVPITS